MNTLYKKPNTQTWQSHGNLSQKGRSGRAISGGRQPQTICFFLIAGQFGRVNNFRG